MTSSKSSKSKSRQSQLTVVPRQVSAPAVEPPTLTVAAQRLDNQPSPRLRQKPRPAGPLASLSLYLLRLLILGVGISTIAGTVLTVVKPTGVFGQASRHPQSPANSSSPESQPATSSGASPIPLKEELPLKKKLTAIVAKYPKIQPQAFFIDLDTGAYVDLKAEVPIAAASTIKIPVLVAFLQAADAGKVHLDEMLVMTKEVKAGGSGDMQYQPLGKKYTALETATKMIAISDNTATNMLIERLGGKAALNQQFQKWGLGATAIKNPLPDLEGTNTTSPRDLAKLLEKVNQGELLSLKSRDRLLSIMEQTQTRTLLPQGLEAGAAIAHKTGDIGTVLGDAGLVDMPTGKRYIGAILAKRPYNDSAARSLIQQMSQTAYQHFKWYRPRPLLKQGE